MVRRRSLSGLLLLLVCASWCVDALRPADVVVVVLSQGDSYHSQLARSLRDNLYHQATALSEKRPKVYLAHEEFPHPGAWTVIPILPRLYETDGRNSSWIVFCEERTWFDLEKLVSVLSQHDHTKEIWLGHGLSDREPTIIHHYEFSIKPHQLQYPLLPAGFAISTAMLKRLVTTAVSIKMSEFSIDAMHELARFIRTPLISLPSVFCLEKNQTDCAMYPMPFVPCGEAVPNEDLYFAVKTCLKFHKDRVPVVKQTWGKDAANIEFFSDVQDDSIPTTPVGIANTVMGHCAKTLTILKFVEERGKKLANLKWLVLADDDTLLSVPRLRQLLSCWGGEEGVVVGERYGYKVHTPQGYNYLTGGGGMAISMAVLPTLAQNCFCHAANSPDDMYLGLCQARLAIPLVHSPFFHQARPTDYPAGYLATQLPVSFHKHWMLDPLSTYQQWFSIHHSTLHSEL